MELKHIETRLARATTLPILSNVVTQLLLLTEDPSASARDYERLIMQDAALTAKILRTANSPYFGGNGNITNLRRALTQVGNNSLRSICLTVSLQSALSTRNLNKAFQPATFWLHSLGVACAAKLLACLTHDQMQAESAFIAGLVHDIGKLALCMFLPQEADSVYALMRTKKISQYEAELEFLGVTHQDIGSMAAERWQLPCIYLSPIARHHEPVNPETGEIDRMTAYVHMGNILVHQIGLDMEMFKSSATEPDPGVLELLNLSEQQYEAIRLALATEVQRLAGQMGL